MTIDEIAAFLDGLDGVLLLRPAAGDGTPEITWGDVFVYFAPDGVIPATQPFATIVTKDYPGDDTSRLERPGSFRVNVAAGKDAFAIWTAQVPPNAGTDDVVIAHPVYGEQHWLAVVNPGPGTDAELRDLLVTAHHLARRRHERRAASGAD